MNALQKIASFIQKVGEWARAISNVCTWVADSCDSFASTFGKKEKPGKVDPKNNVE